LLKFAICGLTARAQPANPCIDRLEKLLMTTPSDRLPPLNALRAFEAAARRLSFTKAADELNVTPGAISQQIKQLEDYAGTPLFKRTGRAVTLTDAAAASLPLVRDAFERIAEAGRILQAPARRGRVMMTSAPSFAAKWLAPRLENFHRAHPGIEAWISADMALTDFAIADADFAIRYGRGQYDGLKSEKLLDETVLPVCSPALLHGGDALKRPEDLRLHTLLHDESGENDPSCPDWTSWLGARKVLGVDGTRGPRFNQGILVIEAAAAGRGVALAKRAIAAADLASGRLVAPFADGTTSVAFGYWLVWPKGRHLNPDVRAFIKWLKSEAANTDVVGV
jgi:LysR family transcriptional regulator, glycine cleavage system transcriptional activator